jgi:hypothetical protein
MATGRKPRSALALTLPRPDHSVEPAWAVQPTTSRGRPTGCGLRLRAARARRGVLGPGALRVRVVTRLGAVHQRLPNNQVTHGCRHER